MTVCSHAFLEWTLTHLDGGKQNEPILLLCLLMTVCCGAGRSHADSPRHMVLPDNTLGKQCGQESARLLSRASESDGVGEAVGGVRAGKSDCSVPPTFITGSPTSASNQITAESSTKTWLKARLFVFYYHSVPLNQPFTTCPCKPILCCIVYARPYWPGC